MVWTDYDYWAATTPTLYDWLANKKLTGPSRSCRWGPRLQDNNNSNYSVYFSEKIDDSSTLVLAECKVIEPAPAERICQFQERSPFTKHTKTIVHPGMVTRIRELPQIPKIVATLGDGPQVYIWNIKARDGAVASQPNLLLHTKSHAHQQALAMSQTECFVISGADKFVTLWDMCDHISALAVKGSTGQNVQCPSLLSHQTFTGHTETVKDLQFCPTSKQKFCSVGDDHSLILWDARILVGLTNKVEKAHEGAIQCVDWGSHNENHILTGSADHSVRIFDCRKLNAPVYKFEHKAPVLRVQWCPNNSSVFGSSADNRIIIWDYEKADNVVEDGQNDSSGILFKHCGHRDKVVDFHWNVNDPWTVVSLSNNFEASGDRSLQIWRMKNACMPVK